MPKRTHNPSFIDWHKTVPPSTRRDFLTKVGKTALLASLGVFGAGCEAVDRGLLDRGLMPVVLEDPQAAGLPKPDMRVHSEIPFNGEFAPHLLNDDVTPTERHFVRNNSGIPERAISQDLRGPNLPLRTKGTMKYGHARPTIQAPRSPSANRGIPKAILETSFTECPSQ